MSIARGSAGFSMVEITVVLVIILGLAALITPGMLGRVDQSRVDASAESLRGIATAIHDPSRGGGSFRQHVGAYPGALSHLTGPITGAGDLDSCGTAYTADQQAAWRGPYLNRTVPATGVPIGIGSVRDDMTRGLVVTATVGDTTQVLRIHVDSVTIEDAAALDVLVDGVRDSVAGSVNWDSVVDGFVTLDYLVAVTACP